MVKRKSNAATVTDIANLPEQSWRYAANQLKANVWQVREAIANRLALDGEDLSAFARTPEYEALEVMDSLHRMFSKSEPMTKAINAMFNKANQDTKTSGDLLANNAASWINEGRIKKYFETIKIIIAYCSKSLRAYDASDTQTAWVNVCGAHHWFGALRGMAQLQSTVTSEVQKQLLQVVKDDRSARARASAQAKPQLAKASVKEQWLQWHSGILVIVPKYGAKVNKSEFARQMQAKFPIITTPITIENWVRAWEKAT